LPANLTELVACHFLLTGLSLSPSDSEVLFWNEWRKNAEGEPHWRQLIELR